MRPAVDRSERKRVLYPGAPRALERRVGKNTNITPCRQLKQHHAAMKNDPERLSTDFLLQVMEGVEG